jgi:hypothetical protein
MNEVNAATIGVSEADSHSPSRTIARFNRQGVVPCQRLKVACILRYKREANEAIF